MLRTIGDREDVDIPVVAEIHPFPLKRNASSWGGVAQQEFILRGKISAVEVPFRVQRQHF